MPNTPSTPAPQAPAPRAQPGGLSKARLREVVGLALVLGHGALLALILALYLLGGFTLDQAITAGGLVGPVFAGYSTAVLRWYLSPAKARPGRPGKDDPGAPAGAVYTLFALGLPLTVLALLIGLTLAQAYHWGLEGFRAYTALVAAVETGFAVQLGLLVEALFAGGGRRP